VHDREATSERERVVEHRPTASSRSGVDDRSQDDDAHVKEHGDAEDEAGHAEGERRAVLPEEAEQPVGDLLGAARELEHLAEHRAQAHDRCDVSEDFAHARLHVGHDHGERDARG
jgi:hypothetical protein